MTEWIDYKVGEAFDQDGCVCACFCYEGESIQRDCLDEVGDLGGGNIVRVCSYVCVWRAFASVYIREPASAFVTESKIK